MRAEHPEADAGEGDGPQRVSTGHVQEEVSHADEFKLLHAIDYTLLKNFYQFI